MVCDLPLFGTPYIIMLLDFEKGRVAMEYMSCAEAAGKWGISERRVQKLCEGNRIPGVVKFGQVWLIPKNAKKPVDMRLKRNLGKS